MKVLFINVDSGNGSTGRICLDIASALIDNGNQAIVAFGRCLDTKKESISYRISGKFSIFFHVFISRVFDRTGFGSSISTKKFIKMIKEFNPDVIHLHNLHGYYVNVRILFNFLKSFNKPIVWTLHDCWPFTGHCAYFSFVNCERWKEMCYQCPQKKSFPKSLLLDCSKNNYFRKKDLFNGLQNLTIITPSFWLANLVKQSFLSCYPVKVINNGIDYQIFNNKNISLVNFKAKYKILDRKIILGVATPWTKRKGFDDFINLSKMIPNDFVIVLIGLSKKQKENLPKNVIGLERTDNIGELVSAYKSSFVFFNPTYEDNYPTTNLEAQACGTPIITYNSGGSAESCPTKQVVEQGDLRAVLNLILEDNLVVKDQDFSKACMISQYINLYKSILNKE